MFLPLITGASAVQLTSTSGSCAIARRQSGRLETIEGGFVCHRNGNALRQNRHPELVSGSIAPQAQMLPENNQTAPQLISRAT
jgi:hypothetical protein